jgi:hypothetical protein
MTPLRKKLYLWDRVFTRVLEECNATWLLQVLYKIHEGGRNANFMKLPINEHIVDSATK